MMFRNQPIFLVALTFTVATTSACGDDDKLPLQTTVLTDDDQTNPFTAGNNGGTNGGTNGDTNGSSNGDTNGSSNGDTNGTTTTQNNGTTNGGSNGTTNGTSGNTSVTLGAPIASGCMAGVSPRLPIAPLPPLSESQDGELGFDAEVSCNADIFDITFEERNFSGPLTSAEIDAWDLASGTWLGQWDASLVGTELWQATTDASINRGCADLSTTMFSGVGYDNGVPSAPSGSVDPGGAFSFAAMGFFLSSSGDETTGIVDTTNADEVWFWAVYPDQDASFGPFPMTSTGQNSWDAGGVALTNNNLRTQGMVYGMVACRNGNITGVMGR